MRAAAEILHVVAVILSCLALRAICLTTPAFASRYFQETCWSRSMECGCKEQASAAFVPGSQVIRLDQLACRPSAQLHTACKAYIDRTSCPCRTGRHDCTARYSWS
jgi:hypothetical protein